MKLKYLLSFMAISAVTIGTADAAVLFDIYAGATIGAGASTVFEKNETDSHSAQSYGAVLGMDVPFVRIELEYNFMNHDYYKLHLGMINAYAKMPTTLVQPYLGLGVGSTFDGEFGPTDTNININESTAYQAMLGLTFTPPVLPFKIDIEGRAIYIPDVYDIADINPDILQYELRAKLRYIF